VRGILRGLGAGISLCRTESSRLLFWNAPYVSFAMDNGDNLERGCFCPVDYGVVGVAGQRPKTQRTRCEIGAGMAEQWSLGNKRASIVERLFHAVGASSLS
jgi:hypothetical protein